MITKPGGHLHGGEQSAGGSTNLFSQGEKEKTSTVYEKEEDGMFEKKTIRRRSMWRWRCLWNRELELRGGGHIHGDEQPHRPHRLSLLIKLH